MKQALTLLLTAAYVFVSLPAFGEDAAAAKADSSETKTDAAATEDKPKKEKKAKKSDTTKSDSAKSDSDTKAKTDSDAKSDSGTATKTDGDNKDSDSKASKPAAQGNLASRAASFFTGAFFGTPIAIVREIGGETKIATKDLVGETDNWFLIVPALPLGIIGGVLSGTPQGMMFGLKNAFEGSLDEPFSKESFSLADDLED